ncbi:MAG: carotenoid oxygenase family protein [Haliea sp.]|jgi:all-trans-8'-apo-beta-carotenal 15,15'-oxygenase|nr:carotenoid oxygenase family protein [Haliea sp.]
MTTLLALPEKPRVLPGCELYGYETLFDELSYWIKPENIVGEIPAGLEGTLYMNCPGRNRIGEQQYGHWFDGDGMISAVTIKGGRVHYKNRYVRTPKFVNETAAQKILYRGVGTQIPGGILKNMFRMPGNAANTSVILHGGKLLALWEGGKPYELDPATLETVGEYRYEGALTAAQPFSAHPRLDPRTGMLYNFGVFGVPKPKLHFYRIDPGGAMVDNVSQYVGDYSMVHDFAITERHAVFILCPAFMRTPFKFVLGARSIFESIEFDNSRNTKVVVLELATGKLVREYEFEGFFGFHIGNAHEHGDNISVDALCVKNMDVMGGLADVFAERGDDFKFLANGARFTRFTMNLASGAQHQALVEGSIAGEFPSWNPRFTGRENRYTWLSTIIENGTPYSFNAVQKVDHQTGELKVFDFGAGRFSSEVNFIPHGKDATEDEGYLISIVYNHARKKSEVVIVDAGDMRTEIAVIPLEHHVPFGFHGGFYSETFV